MRSVLHKILDKDLTSGEVIRALRVESGISQDELYKITGIARSNISAIENDRLEVTAYYAKIFAAALGVHPSEILFPNGKYEKTKEILEIEKKAAVALKKHAAR